MDTGIRRLIADFLAVRHTMSLATCGNGRPWASSVFFVSDEELQLYFLTDPETLHGHNLECGRVAATVNEDCESWSEIQGVQLTGTVRQVPEADRATLLELYFQKFPEVGRMGRQPRNDQERLIGQRLLSTPLYHISPDWLRLIDNRTRFGFKQEISL